ncbi:hypothetical protein [Methylobacterium sp. ID0610]|uniref:hypothetical protein n=1 Tax=Methylobacterium carpenticola TaxID=3344827 RepID=UPI0036C65B64
MARHAAAKLLGTTTECLQWGKISGNHQAVASFVWLASDRLRGNYRQFGHGWATLTFAFPRRPDCELEPTEAANLAEIKPKSVTASKISKLYI